MMLAPGARRSLVAVAITALAGSLSGCAMSTQVQKIGVEYNAAVAGMANELTLLNIVRAKEDMPLHYTTVNRLTGSVTVKGSTTFGQVKDKAKTVTSTRQTTTPPAAGATIVDTLTNTGVTGGNGVYPGFGGEISSGPSFDIGILDSQKFYQGILAPIPFATIENFISQGYDNRLLIRLLVEKVELKLKDDVDGVGKAGAVIFTLENAATGPQAEAFAATMACYRLGGGVLKKPAVRLAPLSRVTRDVDGKLQPLRVEDLARFDGKTLDLQAPDGASLPISADGTGDDQVLIKRLSEDKKVASLALIGKAAELACPPVFALSDDRRTGPKVLPPQVIAPDQPPTESYYLSGGQMVVLKPATPGVAGGLPTSQEVTVEQQITFRSVESVLRFLGRYLQAAESNPNQTFDLDGHPLFSVTTYKVEDPIVEASLLKKTYAIADDTHRRRNMAVIALIEQLVNLHKEATDRPASVPVYALP